MIRLAYNRRRFVVEAGSALVSSGLIFGPGGARADPLRSAKPFAPVAGPRARVLYCNDLSGDIDGLFSAVHAILSPSIELCGMIGTAAAVRATETAQASAGLASEMLRLTGRDAAVKVHIGAPRPIGVDGTPVPSAGTQAIIAEARRTDSALPLYVAVGGGLTEVASALMLEPAIAGRFTLVWIGGQPYPAGGYEYNFNIDPKAAQHIFNQTTLPIWQVTSGAYAGCAVSDTEIQEYVAPCGPIGAWLYDRINQAGVQAQAKYKLNLGETYTLGDSPLVLLTALTDWVPSGFSGGLRYQRTGSSPYHEICAPLLLGDGKYQMRSEGRKIRVYEQVDTRLMFSDFFAKLRANAVS